MRRAAKVDVNQAAIVEALRSIPGVSVFSLAGVGRGFPDLAVGYKGHNYLLEIKPPGGVRGGLSRQTLTDAEHEWHRTWRGQRAIVCSVEQALFAIGVDRTSTPARARIAQEARS